MVSNIFIISYSNNRYIRKFCLSWLPGCLLTMATEQLFRLFAQFETRLTNLINILPNVFYTHILTYLLKIKPPENKNLSDKKRIDFN